MAAKKKKKASKKKSPVRAAKAKKTPARKAKKAVKKTAKRTAKKASKKSATRVKAKPAARKPAKKAAKKKQIVGEGNYQASRTFLKDQSSFVKKNKSSIPAMGREASRALEGPEGDALRQAETEAASHSRENLT